jgi:hypothetical protein
MTIDCICIDTISIDAGSSSGLGHAKCARIGLVYTEHDIDVLPAASHRLFIDLDTKSATMVEYE